jgi:hypothetical protein
MRPDEVMQSLEETRNEIIRFTNELDALLVQNEIDEVQYKTLLDEKLQGKAKEELISYIDDRIAEEQEKLLRKSKEKKTKRKVLIEGVAIVFVLLAFAGFMLTSDGSLTGYITATKQVQEIINYNQTFDHYTETQLDLANLTSLKISGVLEGTGAKVKLRINGIDYTVANIANPAFASSQITGMATGDGTGATEQIYALTSDKASYSLGETVTLTVAPEVDNKSFYVIIRDLTQKLDANTFITQHPGEHQAIAIIVLPSDMLRLEVNFTVTEATSNGTPIEPPLTTNETNQTNETNTTVIPEIPPETPTGYQFVSLCLETCNLAQASNPILIVEPDENSTLTIRTIEVVQTRENQAPVQDKNIPDITLAPGQPTTLDLNDYFSDPDRDVVQYDINNIPEINATIVDQHNLMIMSETPGTYVAYIYATDGNKLTTSNTFQIIINEANQTPTTPIISNETLPANATPNEIADQCSNPDLNLRPSTCFIGVEEQAFASLAISIQDNKRQTMGLFTRFGNLIIRGLLIQDATGEPNPNDFQLGFSQINGFVETKTNTAWIASGTGNLYITGKIYENQDTLQPSQDNAFVIRNKFGLVLGYFDEINGDLYLRGNLVQLGKI